jgi:hypothetical protein
VDDQAVFVSISGKEDKTVGALKWVGMPVALATNVLGHHFTAMLVHRIDF